MNLQLKGSRQTHFKPWYHYQISTFSKKVPVKVQTQIQHFASHSGKFYLTYGAQPENPNMSPTQYHSSLVTASSLCTTHIMDIPAINNNPLSLFTADTNQLLTHLRIVHILHCRGKYISSLYFLKYPLYRKIIQNKSCRC
jgi:hypothetical protein